MILTPQQVKDEITELSFQKITVKDSIYKCPHEQWVLEDLAQYHRKHPFDFVPESNDCDDASTELKEHIRQAVQKNPDWRGYGVPVAIIDITVSAFNTIGLSTWGNHEAEIIRTAEGKWLFYDRQNPNNIRDFRSLLSEEMGGDGSVIRCNSAVV